MTTQPESRLQRRIRAALMAAFPRSFWTKFHGGPFTRAGIPDLVGCVEGLSFWLEVKQPGHQPSVIQQHVMRTLRDAGACACVVTSPEEAVAVVRDVLARR